MYKSTAKHISNHPRKSHPVNNSKKGKKLTPQEEARRHYNRMEINKRQRRKRR